MHFRAILFAAIAALAILATSLPALADKVGVAAAVEPDAFSSLSGAPNKQLNIGKSIFYNERINTTASGLVQVLLVDGSTFTVGPNSNLVIDKFVYDPKKKTGEVVATFSKGAMRFVGGKLSKNDGGVTIGTPAGSLAVRGGIVQLAFWPGTGIISFIYGDYAKLRLRNGQVLTAYEPRNTIDTKIGRIRPTTAADINLVVAALSKGGNVGGNSQSNADNQAAFQLADVSSVDELISDANTTNITGQILQQLRTDNSTSNESQDSSTNLTQNELPPLTDPPGTDPPGTDPPDTDPPDTDPPDTDPPDTDPPLPPASGGAYGGYVAGFDERTGNDKYALVTGELGSSEGTVSFLLDLESGDVVHINFDATGNADANSITANGKPVINGSANFTASAEPICDSCEFLDFGKWNTGTIVYRGAGPGNTNLNMSGWWVAGQATSVADINELGNQQAEAFYNGGVRGTVANRLDGGDWIVTDHTGQLYMHWDFASRLGELEIRNFDGRSYGTGTGGLRQPNINLNQFGGSLSQIGGTSIGGMTGGATGSFVNNGPIAAGGVMGNWGVRSDAYRATGIFGGVGTPQR